MNRLDEILEKHKNLNFPDAPENDVLADWIMELLEVDSYYFGIISSFKDTSKKESLDKKNFQTLHDSLAFINNLSKSDYVIYQDCMEYLQSLKNLIQCYEENRK